MDFNVFKFDYQKRMIELTPQQALERLNNSENLSVIIKEHKGIGNHSGLSRRAIGDKKTDAEKELIANLAVDNKLNGGTYSEVAREFGLHPNTVNDYIHDALNNSPIKNDEKSIRKPMMLEERISSKALDKLVDVIDRINDEKLEKEGANSLASVAVKMATVNEKMSGDKNGGKGITINIFPPKIMNESHFDVIEVKSS